MPWTDCYTGKGLVPGLHGRLTVLSAGKWRHLGGVSMRLQAVVPQSAITLGNRPCLTAVAVGARLRACHYIPLAWCFGLQVRLILSGFGEWRYLDCVSIRAGKQEALEYVRQLFNVPVDRCMAAGDSGNDTLMLAGGLRLVSGAQVLWEEAACWLPACWVKAGCAG